MSVQSTSMAPKFWMEFRFLTMVFFLLMDTAPLARQVVTIMGSISGVRPTAMEMPNRKASSQSPLVSPLMKNTSGTITSMKRISTQDTAFTPRVKLVSTASPATALAMEPNRVASPTQTATAVALPETTLLPMKAMLARSVTFSCGSHTAAFFSTGSLSPVRLAWLRNKSFASRMRRSAGIMSPAERCTMSPATSSSSGISASSCSRRVTVQVVVIMASSFSAALPLRDSCTKRSVPEISTMVRMMTTVRQSKSSGVPPNSEHSGNTMSVMMDTSARQHRMAVKGLMKAPASRFTSGWRFSRVTRLAP